MRSEGAAAMLGEKAVLAHWRLGDGARLTLALNLGETAVELAIDRPWARPFYVSAALVSGRRQGRVQEPSPAWLEAAA